MIRAVFLLHGKKLTYVHLRIFLPDGKEEVRLSDRHVFPYCSMNRGISILLEHRTICPYVGWLSELLHEDSVCRLPDEASCRAYASVLLSARRTVEPDVFPNGSGYLEILGTD